MIGGRTTLAAGLLLLTWAGDAWSQGAIGFAPGIGSAFDGTALSVLPVVSADRRYVRLSTRPIFNTITGFDTFPVPGAVAGGGFGGGLGGIGGGGGLGGGGLGGIGGGGPGLGPGFGGGGGGLRSVPPGQARAKAAAAPQAPAAAPQDAGKTFVPSSVARQLAAGNAPAPRAATPRAGVTPPTAAAPRTSTTYRPGDPYAGLGPTGGDGAGSTLPPRRGMLNPGMSPLGRGLR